MGLTDAKNKAISALQQGSVQAEERPDISEKNLLKTGIVTQEEVIQLLKVTRGDQYRSMPHKDVAEVTVHVFEPVWKNENWHIKCYFLDPDCWFISVHKSHIRRKSWSSTKKVKNLKRYVRRARK